VTVHQRSGDLGAADVERCHEVVVHLIQFSPSTIRNSRRRRESDAPVWRWGRRPEIAVDSVPWI
jgi:hypothetical protein